jgi:hypothetical protein
MNIDSQPEVRFTLFDVGSEKNPGTRLRESDKLRETGISMTITSTLFLIVQVSYTITSTQARYLSTPVRSADAWNVVASKNKAFVSGGDAFGTSLADSPSYDLSQSGRVTAVCVSTCTEKRDAACNENKSCLSLVEVSDPWWTNNLNISD